MTASAINPPLGMMARLVEVAQPTLLIASFWLSCIFYSVGFNLLLLQMSVLGPLLVLLISGPRRLTGVMEASPKLFALCVGVIVLLCFHYTFITVSPEASYPYTWIVASIPLWILALSVTGKPRYVAIGIGFSVLAMAIVSAVRFVLYDQRAYDPLADPNNYATLVYLAWIPAAHFCLLQLWERPSWLPYAGLAVMTVAASLSVFATGSRAGSAILVGAVAAWAAWAIWYRRDLKPVILVVVLVLASYWLFGVLSPELKAAAMGSSEVDSSLNVRWLMLDAAFQIAANSGINGTGLYTFSLLYPAYRSLGDQSTGGVLVHNDYVQLLVEGGPWLLLPVVVLGLATCFVLIRSFDRGRGLSFAHGCALAIAAAMAHATLNFVFYSLALCVALGVLSFFAFGGRQASSAGAKPASRAAVGTWLVGLAFAGVAWFYLALDTFAFGVFSGQPSLPSAQEVRTDADKALAFARYHHKLNDNRSIPVLGEALLLAQRPYTDQTRDATLAAFRDALVRHPWSVQARLAMLDYVLTHRISGTHLSASEQPERMLLDTLREMPADMDVVRQLVRFYMLIGQPGKAIEQIRLAVFPWMELLYRRDPNSYDELVAILREVGPADGAALTELLGMRDRLERVARDEQPDVWFMRLQSQA
jgi:hypothetical protein